MQSHLRPYITIAVVLFTMFAAQTVLSTVMRFYNKVPSILTSACAAVGTCSARSAHSGAQCSIAASNVSAVWHPPAQYFVNNLTLTLNSTGTYGFIYNTSQSPQGTSYNWCNMPHVNPTTYKKPSSDYRLEYVEVIHRHHKRTPYASNTFPMEGYAWHCSDEGLFYGGKPLDPAGNDSASTYWSVYTSESNPFPPQGFNGTCQFPQITRQGLDDSWEHGADLKAVYADLLDFIPVEYDPAATTFRVTNNVITSQVASMLIAGMYPAQSGKDTPLLIQPNSIDSLEPRYSCPASAALFSDYSVGSSATNWTEHLTASSALFSQLDNVSGIDPDDSGWHQSFDHYFDNLSARLCHQKPLPCSVNDTSACIEHADAETVFRLGQYEYSFIYRDAPQSLKASIASYGVWTAELAAHLRRAAIGDSQVRYRHNVAHDGSISRLLSILQVERMVWPGMGSEVVFELYKKEECHFLRVLWAGQVLQSSHPSFRSMDMVPLNTFLAYIDELVGQGAKKVPQLCEASED